MARELFFSFAVLLLCNTVRAQCVLPQSIRLEYMAKTFETVEVFRMCGKKICGALVREIFSDCDAKKCPNRNPRCNSCLSDILLKNFPRFFKNGKPGEYGVLFAGDKCPLFTFPSDWATGGLGPKFDACIGPNKCGQGKPCRGKPPVKVTYLAVC